MRIVPAEKERGGGGRFRGPPRHSKPLSEPDSPARAGSKIRLRRA